METKEVTVFVFYYLYKALIKVLKTGRRKNQKCYINKGKKGKKKKNKEIKD